MYIRKLQRLEGVAPQLSDSQPEVEGDEDADVSGSTFSTTRQRPKTAKTRTPPMSSGYTLYIFLNLISFKNMFMLVK